MGIGPILIFDKSTLESLKVDESVWLDAFYKVNITPLFFVETLADLEKEVKGGRTPEQVVGNLAEKTPSCSHPNVHHISICISELMGRPIEMRGFPVLGGGRPVMAEGRRGIVFEQPDEMEALHRWQGKKFLEVERDFARLWRKSLSELDLESYYQIGKTAIAKYGRPCDFVEAKKLAKNLLNKTGSRYSRRLLELFLPNKITKRVIDRWTYSGSPSMGRYAPYTAHVLLVDLLFSIGLGADLISRERRTNKIDIAYLYYLPFCMVFTSHDWLHSKIAPLFLTDEQVFVDGPALKADLTKLDDYYSKFPEEVKARGVMSFAHHPPDGDFLVTRLWDKLMPSRWRESDASSAITKEDEEKIFKKIDSVVCESGQSNGETVGIDEADHVIIQHMVPAQKGKWRLVPAEALKKGPKEN